MAKIITAETREQAIRKGIRLMSDHYLYLKRLESKWLEDEVVMATLIKKDPFAYRVAPESIRKNKIIIEYALKNAGMLLDSMPEEVRDDKTLVMLAVKSCGYAIVYASPRLKNDKEVVAEAIKNSPRSLTYASAKMRKDSDLIKLAFDIEGPFIVEPLAQAVFAKLDARMIRDCQCCDRDNLTVSCDVNKMLAHPIYKRFEKFYKGELNYSEVLEFQKMLLTRKSIIRKDIDDDYEFEGLGLLGY